MTGTVSRRRGTRRLFAAEVLRLAAKRALINTAIVKTRGSSPMCSSSRIASGPVLHVFDGVTVADIVRPFYGVVHMPFPVIFMGLPSATVMPPCADTVWNG